jgi:putative DNA primase/helicase
VKISKLQKEEAERILNSKFYEPACRVLDKWKELCHPTATEVRNPSGERMKNVIARFKGDYTEEQLIQCVIGYSHFSYVVSARRTPHGTPAQRRVDAELIFRDPKRVDQGIALAKEVAHRERVLPEFNIGVTSTLSTLGQAAVVIANAGYHVFPVVPQAKHPATIHGLLDATTDVQRIMNFWRNHPEHNIGIRCGIESEIFVLDVDGEGGYESLRELELQRGELPKTLSVVTPSGGQHFYFRHPGVEIRNTTAFPAFGLDIRGDGGYVLGPPSIGPNCKPYEVDERIAVAIPPVWLVQLLREFQTTSQKVDVAEYHKMFEGLPEGQRDTKMTQYMGHLWHKLDDPPAVLAHSIALNHEYCKPPMPDKQVKKIWESLSRREARKADQEIQMRLDGGV